LIDWLLYRFSRDKVHDNFMPIRSDLTFLLWLGVCKKKLKSKRDKRIVVYMHFILTVLVKEIFLV